MAGLVSLAVMGMDQHENGVMAVSRILREAQISSSYLGRFQTPDSIVDAMRKDPAAVIGISCHSWEYLDMVPKLVAGLRAAGLDIPVVIGGSVLTKGDIEAMQKAGVHAAFASGAQDTEILDVIRDLINQNKKEGND